MFPSNALNFNIDFLFFIWFLNTLKASLYKKILLTNIDDLLILLACISILASSNEVQIGFSNNSGIPISKNLIAKEI